MVGVFSLDLGGGRRGEPDGDTRLTVTLMVSLGFQHTRLRRNSDPLLAVGGPFSKPYSFQILRKMVGYYGRGRREQVMAK